jgi:phosphoserine phosphatase
VEAVALRREMELAKLVQQKLIPPQAPQIEGIESIGWTVPASITGGDCYDLWRCADGRLGIFVADATGHGIGPAMVVSQVRTLIRAMCDVQQDPQALLACANARMADDLDSGHFVTAFMGLLAPGGELSWCSAGHGPILLRCTAGGPLVTLEPTAPPLGVLPDFLADRPETTRLHSGGLLAIVSDGIIEAFSAAREEFGVQRLIGILQNESGQPLHELIDRIRRSVRDWHGSDEPRDDQTVVLARRQNASSVAQPDD